MGTPRRGVLGALVVVVLVASLGVALAVDRSKFKTCEQSSFCSRQRSIEAGRLAYGVVPGSAKFDGTELKATLKESVSNTFYTMTLTRYADNVVRMQVDEVDSLKPRYRVNDVLLDSVRPVAFESWNEETHTLVLDENTEVRIEPEIFRVTLYSYGVPVLASNQRGLFYFEWLREKPAEVGQLVDTAVADAAAPMGSQQGSKPATVPGINFDKAWDEHFGGDHDVKRNGPESIGLDFTFLGAKQVYGIPEHATSLALKETTGKDGAFKDPYRLYNLDVFEYEINENMALYGHVPFMMGHSENQTTGLFWLNAAETWVDVSRPETGGVLSGLFGSDSTIPQVDTHWMSESGIIDVFFFAGPAPKDVLRQFTSLVGRQELPPQFAIAYHQCRWNYQDQADVAAVNSKFEELDIPYDVIWLDIEHTDGKRYFTWDKRNFATPESMIADVAHYGRKIVTIVDPHIKRDDNYDVHRIARENGLYVKDDKGADYDGHCWPGASSWLDFLDPKIRDWWAERFSYDLYKGSTKDVFIWNDMNEPSVFNGPEVTMRKNARHVGGWEHRDVHNLYGMLMHRATAQGLIRRNPDQNTRPFVLSRALYAGTQRWGAVWTGDNKADWQHLWAAQPMLMSLGLSGVAFVGADVGGFFGNPAPELLLRWYQVGAYQPFFRAHAHLDTARREPWVHGDPWTGRFRAAILSRYQILPYLYTVFHQTSLDGSPVMRPLWFDFPSETETFTIDSIFMLGSDILVAPVVAEGQTTVDVHLPGSQPWYELDGGKVLEPGRHSVAAPIEMIPVYQRGGSIVPRKMRIRRSSATMKDDPYTLFIAPDRSGNAQGLLYIDDRETFDYQKGVYLKLGFQFATSADGKTSTLNITHLSGEGFKTIEEIERVAIRGVQQKPSQVTAHVGSSVVALDFYHSDPKNTLIIRDPNVRLIDQWNITITY